MAERKTVQCAIYTRKSSEYGLEQDFNSLDAQREACEAYVKSQSHEGWKLLPAHYDDGGISGATLERPAIQKLLKDVRDGKVDVIVVYKVDRLTRSLADFAKLVELFDAHNASFVSVTQQFNTTNSMGRLTLNVLLSFAQFEREVTAERIRDKVAASKKKGMWLGGVVPLGYAVKDKKLIFEEKDAELVRTIFRRYLELPSLKALKQDLDAKGVVTKTRTLSNGRVVGGQPFFVGPLAVILKNRIYIGEITHGDKIYPGQHQPIIDRALFDAVQAKITASCAEQKAKHAESGSILMGRIYDDAGNRMVPVHTRKGALRYRYYVTGSSGGGNSGSVLRVPASGTEAAILAALQKRYPSSDAEADGAPQAEPRKYIEKYVERIIATKQGMTVTLKSDQCDDTTTTIEVPFYVRGRTTRREIIPGEDPSMGHQKTLRAERRLTLLTTIAQARGWADELITGRTANTRQIAERDGCTERHIRQVLPLAFLAPDIVQAAIDGELPADLVLTRIRSDLPLSWQEQRATFALD
jgi:site-specific DNA recombinase